MRALKEKHFWTDEIRPECTYEMIRSSIAKYVDRTEFLSRLLNRLADPRATLLDVFNRPRVKVKRDRVIPIDHWNARVLGRLAMQIAYDGQQWQYNNGTYYSAAWLYDYILDTHASACISINHSRGYWFRGKKFSRYPRYNACSQIIIVPRLSRASTLKKHSVYFVIIHSVYIKGKRKYVIKLTKKYLLQ